jgi:hypothetical protein
MNVQSFHAQNPNGIAMMYARLDNPAVCYPWHETSINVSYQEVHNYTLGSLGCPTYDAFQQHTIENWPGGTDNLTDGQAANVGTMRAWNITNDTAGDNPGCRTNTVCHAWRMGGTGTADLISRLIVYGAKEGALYGKGWDGIWSDNAVCANSSRTTCDGLNLIYDNLRQWLPGKIVGGNGTWEVRNMPGFTGNCCGGWLGTDVDGFKKMADANLVEGLGYYGANADLFISWNSQVLNYPDPYGMPRYNAFWDFGGDSSLQRMRWGLTLAMMASSYYESSSTGWYDEFWGGTLNQRGYLGMPIAAAVKLANGVWRRDFQYGVSLNNSSGSAHTVSLGGTYRHLTGSQAPGINDGSSVSSVTIPNQDGLILLR